ncbi:MAG: chemotaxis protein CheW, partial [Propionibacteriaceae bacterium]|nr:chemotaxis protein CheW [Propionibacteriaceae bacterium]
MSWPAIKRCPPTVSARSGDRPRSSARTPRGSSVRSRSRGRNGGRGPLRAASDSYREPLERPSSYPVDRGDRELPVRSSRLHRSRRMGRKIGLRNGGWPGGTAARGDTIPSRSHILPRRTEAPMSQDARSTPTAARGDNPVLQFVGFRLGDEDYAIAITKIQEIILMKPITRLPQAP